jgi:hypothetical protein
MKYLEDEKIAECSLFAVLQMVSFDNKYTAETDNRKKAFMNLLN